MTTTKNQLTQIIALLEADIKTYTSIFEPNFPTQIDKVKTTNEMTSISGKNKTKTMMQDMLSNGKASMRNFTPLTITPDFEEYSLFEMFDISQRGYLGELAEQANTPRNIPFTFGPANNHTNTEFYRFQKAYGIPSEFGPLVRMAAGRVMADMRNQYSNPIGVPKLRNFSTRNPVDMFDKSPIDPAYIPNSLTTSFLTFSYQDRNNQKASVEISVSKIRDMLYHTIGRFYNLEWFIMSIAILAGNLARVYSVYPALRADFSLGKVKLVECSITFLPKDFNQFLASNVPRNIASQQLENLVIDGYIDFESLAIDSLHWVSFTDLVANRLITLEFAHLMAVTELEYLEHLESNTKHQAVNTAKSPVVWGDSTTGTAAVTAEVNPPVPKKKAKAPTQKRVMNKALNESLKKVT